MPGSRSSSRSIPVRRPRKCSASSPSAANACCSKSPASSTSTRSPAKMYRSSRSSSTSATIRPSRSSICTIMSSPISTSYRRAPASRRSRRSSVDDLPIVALTLHGARYNRGQLNDAAQRLIDVDSTDSRRRNDRDVRRPRPPSRRFGRSGETRRLRARARCRSPRRVGSTDVISPVGSLRSDAAEIPVHAGSPFSTVAASCGADRGVKRRPTRLARPSRGRVARRIARRRNAIALR